MGDFTTAGRKWLACGSPSTNRLAVGGSAMPATSTKAAYQKLDDMLVAVQVDPRFCSHFFYQINWPRASSVVPQLRLNRLTKVTAFSVRSVSLQLEDDKASVQSSSPDGENYCRLECDHSTPGRVEPFGPIDLVEKLFQELCGMVEKTPGRARSKGLS